MVDGEGTLVGTSSSCEPAESPTIRPALQTDHLVNWLKAHAGTVDGCKTSSSSDPASASTNTVTSWVTLLSLILRVARPCPVGSAGPGADGKVFGSISKPARRAQFSARLLVLKFSLPEEVKLRTPLVGAALQVGGLTGAFYLRHHCYRLRSTFHILQ